MTSRSKSVFCWLLAPCVFSACAQIVGIEDPIPIDQKPPESTSSSGSGASSSGGSSSSSSSSGMTGGNPSSPWIGWRMPNPATAGLPNPSVYSADATNKVVYDNVTGLLWQQIVDNGSYTYDEAKAFCDKLTYGGYTDWRLPWRIELASLVDFTRSYPAIDPTFPNTPNDGFWSASIYSSNPDYAWAVRFDDGDTEAVTTNTPYRARCVR